MKKSNSFLQIGGIYWIIALFDQRNSKWITELGWSFSDSNPQKQSNFLPDHSVRTKYRSEAAGIQWTPFKCLEKTIGISCIQRLIYIVSWKWLKCWNVGTFWIIIKIKMSFILRSTSCLMLDDRSMSSIWGQISNINSYVHTRQQRKMFILFLPEWNMLGHTIEHHGRLLFWFCVIILKLIVAL